jgi:hypothetical protein
MDPDSAPALARRLEAHFASGRYKETRGSTEGPLSPADLRRTVEEMGRHLRDRVDDGFADLLRYLNAECPPRGTWPRRLRIGAPDALFQSPDSIVAAVLIRDDKSHNLEAKVRWAVSASDLCTEIWLAGGRGFEAHLRQAAEFLDQLPAERVAQVGVCLWNRPSEAGESAKPEILRPSKLAELDKAKRLIWEWAVSDKCGKAGDDLGEGEQAS